MRLIIAQSGGCKISGRPVTLNDFLTERAKKKNKPKKEIDPEAQLRNQLTVASKRKL